MGMPSGSGAALYERRRWLTALSGLAAAALVACDADDDSGTDAPSGRDLKNFRAVYGDPARRAEFVPFLRNVFHLFPEQAFDDLIADAVAADPRDPAAYQRIAARLDSISPALSAFRYALPALARQKREMARQTAQLLGAGSKFDGYLELGSHGRYLDLLADEVRIEGRVFTSAPRAAGYSPEDVVDRGQLTRVGTELPWTDYAPLDKSLLADESVGLITVYIGLHHSEDAEREAYVRSLHRVLRSGGKLIVRDHDVTDERQRHLVSLAHDVFNVGTGESWATNEAERRNFYALDSLVALCERAGFRAGTERLLQAGDPTLNTLLQFSKV